MLIHIYTYNLDLANYIYLWICMHFSGYKCVCVYGYAYICVYVCVWVHIYIYMYLYICV